jgi:2-(1,2-epoxy-1,2-dihydrophenyl)acetyl-CoA isomerase
VTGATFQTITVQHTDGVAVLTLNRPQVLNAFDGAMANEMERAFATLLEDPEVRAVVVTGAGRGFCAGADLKYLHSCFEEDRLDDAVLVVEIGGRIARMVRASGTPVIAAVHGVAAGGGCNLALACDLRIAGDSARFGQVFSRIGLVPDWGGTHVLPRLVGTAKALELCWSGEWVEAPAAERIGLVNTLVPDAELMGVAVRFARDLAAKSSAVVSAIKQALYASATEPLDAMLRWEEEMQRQLFATDRARDAIRSFALPRKTDVS